jgi:hypothetical protein
VTTISLKLTDPLLREVEAEARRRGLSKSALIRDSLEATLRRQRAKKTVTCLELMGDMVGSFHGPRDLSTNRRYLTEAVASHARRNRKNAH